MLGLIIGFVERIIAAFFGSRERDARNYESGAAAQREASLREAEREEEIARKAGEVAEAALDDKRDLRNE